jgi:hypothetical protein
MVPRHLLSRLPLLLPAILCLAIGVLTGLTRAGIDMTELLATRSAWHSILMISGFFGTVIGLERAVASNQRWAFLAPMLSALGGLLLLSDTTASLSPFFFVLASAIFCSASTLLTLKQPALHAWILLLGAMLWLMGNVAWVVNGSSWISIPFGLSFLILTIAAERLELTRFLPPRPYAKVLFILIIGVILIGTVCSALSVFDDNAWLGWGYALLALWLLNFDVAKRTIRQQGVTRFLAICLLSGYAWLLVGGVLLTHLPDLGLFERDAGIHAIALGFIFAMVIGHAPVIFPAVMRIAIPFSALFYLPWLLIQIGMSLRFGAALLSHTVLREAGALINALAVLSFLLCLVIQVIRGFRAQRIPSL